MAVIVQACEDYFEIGRGVREHGFAVLNSCISESGCSHIKTVIDKHPAERAEINYSGTEKRIWDAHQLDSAVKDFGELSDQVMSSVFGGQPKLKTVLAYSNYPISGSDQLLTGRWHLDSLRTQYKLFCFLTKTEESTGPLELVPSSHKASFKAWPLVSGRYIGPLDLGTGRRRYQRLDDDWVSRKCEKGSGSRPLLCAAGTLILVDTSAIHRARPCLEGSRYALCAYYNHF